MQSADAGREVGTESSGIAGAGGDRRGRRLQPWQDPGREQVQGDMPAQASTFVELPSWAIRIDHGPTRPGSARPRAVLSGLRPSSAMAVWPGRARERPFSRQMVRARLLRLETVCTAGDVAHLSFRQKNKCYYSCTLGLRRTRPGHARSSGAPPPGQPAHPLFLF